MQITEFKKIGKSNRIKIYVDNEFFAVLMDETIIQNNLSTTKTYTLEELNKIVFEGQKKVALDTAMNLLSNFTKTEKELKLYLKQKGFLPESISYSVEKLKEYNYLSDDNFAKNYISTKQNSKGKKAILFELKRKGVAEQTIKNYLEKMPNQEEIVLNIAQKFAKNKKEDVKIKEKLFRHLASKGFEFEDINYAIKQVLNTEIKDY